MSTSIGVEYVDKPYHFTLVTPLRKGVGRMVGVDYLAADEVRN
jgi:hypothetical protein